MNAGLKALFTAVVIDAGAAADIQMVNINPHLANFRIDAGGFFDSCLDALDLSDLRADVEMKHSKHIDHPRVTQHLDSLQQLGCRQAELRLLARRCFPPSGTMRVQSNSPYDHRPDAAGASPFDDLG